MITCYLCRVPLDDTNSEVPGWCDTCIMQHQITERYINWGRANHADPEHVASLLFRKFTAIWN